MLNEKTATILPIRIGFSLNRLKLKPMSEKVSFEYFKRSHTNRSMGMLYPKFGMSPECGKMKITHIVIVLISISFTLMNLIKYNVYIKCRATQVDRQDSRQGIHE